MSDTNERRFQWAITTIGRSEAIIQVQAAYHVSVQCATS